MANEPKKYQKQILTNEDGLNSPSAVCFDKPKKQLLVVNVEDGMAYLFSVRQQFIVFWILLV
jgi:hypothetical protein